MDDFWYVWLGSGAKYKGRRNGARMEMIREGGGSLLEREKKKASVNFVAAKWTSVSAI